MFDGVPCAPVQGRERFRVLSIAKERPIMIAEVEELAEDTDSSEEVGLGACVLTSVVRVCLSMGPG